MATEQHCACFCHRDVLADYRAALDRDDDVEAERLATVYSYAQKWVRVDDPLEAAVASGCPCVTVHTPALRTPRPPYKPPSQWKPEDDG